jgi:hypothetical protein
MCSFLTRVHLCIEEGGGHLKHSVHKKCNYVEKKLSTILNGDVIKLASIIFSKMFFLVILNSLILPHTVLIDSCSNKFTLNAAVFLYIVLSISM